MEGVWVENGSTFRADGGLAKKGFSRCESARNNRKQTAAPQPRISHEAFRDRNVVSSKGADRRLFADGRKEQRHR